MAILIGILVVIIAILCYALINLLKRNESYEDIMFSYQQYLNKISDIIDFSEKKLNEVDSKGTFKSDDEVGFFFEQIKQIQEVLNQFIIK